MSKTTLAHYAEKSPSQTNVRCAEWITEKVGYEVDLKTVQLVSALYPKFQRSPENQEVLANRGRNVDAKGKPFAGDAPTKGKGKKSKRAKPESSNDTPSDDEPEGTEIAAEPVDEPIEEPKPEPKPKATKPKAKARKPRARSKSKSKPSENTTDDTTFSDGQGVNDNTDDPRY